MRPTGSSIHRPWQCAASLVLPQVVSDDAEARAEPFRGKGHEVHRYLQRVRAIGVDAALAEVKDPVTRVLCMLLDVDKLPTDLSTEVAFAWNWRARTARELGRDLGHRDYDSLGVDWEEEIPATLDVCGMKVLQLTPAVSLLTRRGFVGDYKAGHTKYPRPGRFGQTLLGAACMRSVYQLDDCAVELIRIDDDGDHHRVRDVVDGWALDAFEEEIAQRMASREQLEADFEARRPLPYRTGDHCRYCRSIKHCDATTALVRAVPAELLRLGIREGFTGAEVQPGSVTVRNAAAVYEAAEVVIGLMNQLKQEVVGIVMAGERVELSDGRVIERRVNSRRHLDGKLAAGVLARLYGQEEAMKSVELKVSLEAVKDCVVRNTDWKAQPHPTTGKMVKPKLETQKKDGVLDKVMAELAAAKAIGTNESETWGPFQPPRSQRKLAAGKPG